MTDKTKEILSNSTLTDHSLTLPDIHLSRDEYLDIKKSLLKIGGKWKGGKVSAFIFPHSFQEELASILQGNKVDLKKDFQFFPTPDPVIDKMLDMIQISDSDRFLEPSAGQGSIIKSILSRNPNAFIKYCELMPQNNDFLQKLNSRRVKFISSDFLSIDPKKHRFDKIIANPPFSKNQDIEHVLHMYHCLKKGGELVSVMSSSWQKGSYKKQKAFRDWLSSKTHTVISLEPGSFKESGTMVETCILYIHK
jgi:phospholipid N-methyltransferase